MCGWNSPAATPFKTGEDGEEKDPAETAAESDFDEDDMEGSLSLAAIEAELKPKVVETFDTIAEQDIYQEDADHHVFIDTFKDTWERVQVMDIQPH